MSLERSEKLIGMIRQLALPDAAAISASCSSRLMPALLRYLEGERDIARQALFTRAQEAIWLFAGGNPISQSDLAHLAEATFAAIPTDEESVHAAEPYAEDAAAAICYGLRLCASGDITNAIWASQRIFDALDHYYICGEYPDPEYAVQKAWDIEADGQVGDISDLNKLVGTLGREDAIQIFRLKSRPLPFVR
ncbi:hypothetical protein [Amantichitinum ursilacus]|nr:hypothetical protein [Amantichitinum ursilacus]